MRLQPREGGLAHTRPALLAVVVVVSREGPCAAVAAKARRDPPFAEVQTSMAHDHGAVEILLAALLIGSHFKEFERAFGLV